MKLPLRRNIQQVADICGVPDKVIIHYIEEEWLHPIDAEFRMLDEEDLCRVILIQDLQEKFGANDESIPIILHLVDQLNYIINNSKEKSP